MFRTHLYCGKLPTCRLDHRTNPNFSEFVQEEHRTTAWDKHRSPLSVATSIEIRRRCQLDVIVQVASQKPTSAMGYTAVAEWSTFQRGSPETQVRILIETR